MQKYIASAVQTTHFMDPAITKEFLQKVTQCLIAATQASTSAEALAHFEQATRLHSPQELHEHGVPASLHFSAQVCGLLAPRPPSIAAVLLLPALLSGAWNCQYDLMHAAAAGLEMSTAVRSDCAAASRASSLVACLAIWWLLDKPCMLLFCRGPGLSLQIIL